VSIRGSPQAEICLICGFIREQAICVIRGLKILKINVFSKNNQKVLVV